MILIEKLQTTQICFAATQIGMKILDPWKYFLAGGKKSIISAEETFILGCDSVWWWWWGGGPLKSLLISKTSDRNMWI